MDIVSKAQNSTVSTTNQHRLAPYRFPKGVSGNPKGRPRKDQNVTRIYQRIFRNRNNRKEIAAAILRELTSKGMAKVLLLREAAERLEGKISQEVTGDFNVVLSLAETVSERRKQLDAD